MNANGKQRARSIEAVFGILRDCTPGIRTKRVKIQSDLHGDMQSQAEMTWPRVRYARSNNMPKVAKFLVG